MGRLSKQSTRMKEWWAKKKSEQSEQNGSANTMNSTLADYRKAKAVVAAFESEVAK